MNATRHLLHLLLLPSALLLLSVPAAASAQIGGGETREIRRIDGQAVNDFLGESEANAGDLDGDGVDDILVGIGFADPFGMGGAGEALVTSGADGSLILKLLGPAPLADFGIAVAGTGDVDGDGVPDLLVGADRNDPFGRNDAGSAFLISGGSGLFVFKFHGQQKNDLLGQAVSGLGDVNGDLIPDLVVAASHANPGGMADAGSVWVFSGQNGALIHRFDGSAPGELFGSSLANVGDLDGDGVNDLAIGARAAGPGGRTAAGSVFVHSGASGALLFRFDGPAGGDLLGTSVAAAGDVDQDGVPDVLAGAPLADPNGVGAAGSAFLFSGATGLLLQRFDGEKFNDQFGWALDGAGDFNGDGLADVALGAFRASPAGLVDAGSVFVFSGLSGERIARLDGGEPGALLGRSVARLGDLDGDGRPEFIAGAVGANPGGVIHAGQASVFGFNPILEATRKSFSISAGGTVGFAIDFPAEDAGARYAILASAAGTGPTTLQGLLVPLTPDPLFRQTLQRRFPPQAGHFSGTLGPAGDAAAVFQAAPGALPAKLLGRTVYLAAVNRNFDFASVARSLAFVP